MEDNSPENLDLQTSREKVVQAENCALSSSKTLEFQNQGVVVKKPTRQWAAWTRQEEENFFNALRQVGKNFEKITCRVQSKNKDQVRHYYYRLVRRMNKLLGPEFCLDARNSKDTIAAMLRWWSLLEKYSCTASKLHLKPRRFKTFVESLAHLLLKDRNKTRRKRASHEESYAFIPSVSNSIMARGSENEVDRMNLLFLENQKIQKVGYTSRSSSIKGNNTSANNCGKGGFTIAKPMKQNRRTGLIASAAYRRWEKAALAGVSLVADAAEQLEQTTSDNVSPNRESFALPLRDCGQEHNAGSTSITPSSSSGIRSPILRDMSLQPLTKLKLQLFPVDDITRKALQKDDFNPYLELTLSARKRISSIIEHLHSKWGKSKISSGELMLFPYEIQGDDLRNCQRWTLQDKISCAADIYGAVGRPSIFRLRYGWLSCSATESRQIQLPSLLVHYDTNMQKRCPEGDIDNVPDGKTPRIERLKDNSPEQCHEMDLDGVPEKQIAKVPISSATILQEETGNENEQEKSRSHKSSTFFASEWADSLTNISIGDLLYEASRAADSTCNNQPVGGSVPCTQSTSFSCDSFDAAIAAHISTYKDQKSISNQGPQSSLWDAEETCDGFSFRRNSPRKQEDSGNSGKITSESHSPISHTNTLGFHDLTKNVPETKSQSNGGVPNPQDRCGNERNPGLADIYWPDSLGADLEIPPFPTYAGQDIILGDSNGLSRLIANSLDVFQNLSFCATEKRTSLANIATSVSSEAD